MTGAVVARVEIQGVVQGVWYRGWTVEQATRRSLRGWVRNRRDGSVEALFIGDSGAVEAMIDSCRGGPRAARVTSVQRFAAADDGALDFRQLPTE